VLAHSVSDVALALEIMAGADDFDATASSKQVEEYSKVLNIDNQSFKKLKIAYLKNAHEAKGFDTEIKAKTEHFIELLRGEGHVVEGVDFALLDYIIPAYYVLTTAEASSNLSRYDGIRYGHRAQKVANLDETYRKSRTEGFSEEVKRRILLGTFVLSSGYYEAYYTKAQKVRRMIAVRTFEIFSEYDFILMPTSPIPAWQIGAKADDPVAMYLADIFTVQANMVGIPGIALPIGRHTEGGHIGIQFLANKFEESKLLATANYVATLLKSSNF
jgi:aspartyl-tRNA(Asn)/glutamyl-tRNA(Gln) amidotransferase subunit A